LGSGEGELEDSDKAENKEDDAAAGEE